jgi:EAL domain-containing protein (putative c-di-GMP-specific phosphodiesterase class I)
VDDQQLRRTMRWLVIAVAADGLVAAALHAQGVNDLARGDRSWPSVVSALGLAVLALLVGMVVRVRRDLRGLSRQLTALDGGPAGEPVPVPRDAPVGGTAPAAVSGVRSGRSRVHALLDRGNLTIALQPIIDLDHDRWVGVEALARFPDGRSPDLWFREAQDAGLGVELELLCVTRALRTLPRLPDDIRLSVNVSPSMILDPRLREEINRAGTPLPRLTLEITEHAAVREYDDITSALLVLRERGVQLAVDDTGAGYASFNHVLRLRPDVIKLDQSLVVGIADDPARRAFVTAIVLLALELDATVTAEGVQSASDLTTVAALGVDHAQGYHVGRPDVGAAIWQTWSHRRWLTGRAPVAIDLRHEV